jgi:hypothetical protein
LDSFKRPLAPTSWTGPHGCHPHRTSPSLLPCLRFERQCRASRLPPPLCPRLAGNVPPPLPATSRPPAPSHSSFFPPRGTPKPALLPPPCSLSASTGKPLHAPLLLPLNHATSAQGEPRRHLLYETVMSFVHLASAIHHQE